MQRFFREKLPNAQADWKQLKGVLSDAVKHVFGKKKRKNRDWFDEHDEEIQQLLRKERCYKAASRGSGHIIWRTGEKNFNAVSHNR